MSDAAEEFCGVGGYRQQSYLDLSRTRSWIFFLIETNFPAFWVQIGCFQHVRSI